MKHKQVFLALALSTFAAGASAELVWKWTGTDGKPVYGKQAPPGVRAEQIEIHPTKPGAFAAPSTGDAGGGKAAAPAVKKAPAAGATVAPPPPPEEPYCPPELPPCKKKLGKGDKPMTPRITPEYPVPKGKDSGIPY